MTEDKKKKYFMYVSSSEKIDSQDRYKSFALAAIPFPGVEFFKDFKTNQHIGKFLSTHFFKLVFM
jgi:myotubularin-related protein 14